MTDHDEIELKLDVSRETADRMEASPILADLPVQRLALRSVYFDMPDQRLRAAGMSLRIRDQGDKRVQTLKIAGSRAAGLFARKEWERPAEDERPVIDDTLPLRALLGSIDPAALKPVFEVRAERTIRVICDGDDSIELAIDRGEIEAGGREETFSEVELELLSGSPSALFALVRQLDAEMAGRIGVLSKAERGYRLQAGAGESAARAESVALQPDMAAAAGFRAIAHACLRQFRLNEMVLARTDQVEALHQARVALRRLRSMMWIFREMLDDGTRDRIYSELRWLAGEMGPARAIDVLAAMIEKGEARDRLAQPRADAYAQARAALDSSRARAAVLDLVEWMAVGAWTADPDRAELRDGPLAIMAANALDKLRRQIKRAGDLNDLSDKQRHRVRIAVKKLRYGCDYFARLYPGGKARKRAENFSSALEKLQDRLGRLNDIVTTPALLRQIGDGAIAAAVPDRAASDRDVAALIAKAEKARLRLIEQKRFWR